MHKIILFILLSAQPNTQCMMQKVKSFICCSDFKSYAALEKQCNYPCALLLAVHKKNRARVKKYITQHIFEQKDIHQAFYRLFSVGSDAEIIKLLLSIYQGDFILKSGILATHSMLFLACLDGNIETIVTLIDAGASPIYHLRNEFSVIELLESEPGRFDINLKNPRIKQAVARFRERYYEKLKKEVNARSSIYACVANCLNVGGDFNPADIVDDYLFEEETKLLRWHDQENIAQDSLDAQEPQTVYFRSEK